MKRSSGKTLFAVNTVDITTTFVLNRYYQANAVFSLMLEKHQDV